jgi:hypothetical protein
MDQAYYCRFASGIALKDTGVAFEHIWRVVN